MPCFFFLGRWGLPGTRMRWKNECLSSGFEISWCLPGGGPSELIGESQPNLQSQDTRQVERPGCSIRSDGWHYSHCQTLPSGWRFTVSKRRTNRSKNSRCRCTQIRLQVQIQEIELVYDKKTNQILSSHCKHEHNEQNKCIIPLKGWINLEYCLTFVRKQLKNLEQTPLLSKCSFASTFEGRLVTASILSLWTLCRSSAGLWENSVKVPMSLSWSGHVDGEDQRGPDGRDREGSLVGSSLHLLPNVCSCEPK